MSVKVISGIRDTVDSKYGISFCRKTTDSPIIIKEVRKDGIFASHGLVPGMVVKAVNGVDVQWKRPTEAATLLAQSEVGQEVSLTVESFTGTVHRSNKYQKWGLTLKNSTKMSGIYISGIEDDGLFAATELEPGMKVIRINGKRCPREARDVIQMVAQTGDDLELIAVHANPRSPEDKENTSAQQAAPRNTKTVESDAVNRQHPAIALL